MTETGIVPGKGSTRITVEIVRSGQPRPYADHFKEGYVFVEHVSWNAQPGEFSPWVFADQNGKPLGPENVPDYLKQRVPELRLPFKGYQWYEEHLTSFGPSEMRGPGWYVFTTKTAFTD